MSSNQKTVATFLKEFLNTSTTYKDYNVMLGDDDNDFGLPTGLQTLIDKIEKDLKADYIKSKDGKESMSVQMEKTSELNECLKMKRAIITNNSPRVLAALTRINSQDNIKKYWEDEYKDCTKCYQR